MADSTFTTKDGARIFYKDWGKGQPIVFHHGWPLSADDWDSQMLFFMEQGYRVIAHDRRGHGRSTQTDLGNDMDTYAADSAALVAHLDLKDAIHVGHSTGGGEVIRYVAQHGYPSDLHRRRTQSGCDGIARGFPVPRQQFGDAACGMIGQSCEHVG
jgi:non-heme chloroperoxidase